MLNLKGLIIRSILVEEALRPPSESGIVDQWGGASKDSVSSTRFILAFLEHSQPYLLNYPVHSRTHAFDLISIIASVVEPRIPFDFRVLSWQN
jgi:hypothetical protein